MHLQVHVLLFKCLSLSLVLPEQVVLSTSIKFSHNLLDVFLFLLVCNLNNTLFMIFSDLFLLFWLLLSDSRCLRFLSFLLSEYTPEYRTVIL
jgi:hypothetical protein